MTDFEETEHKAKLLLCVCVCVCVVGVGETKSILPVWLAVHVRGLCEKGTTGPLFKTQLAMNMRPECNMHTFFFLIYICGERNIFRAGRWCMSPRGWNWLQKKLQQQHHRKREMFVSKSNNHEAVKNRIEHKNIPQKFKKVTPKCFCHRMACENIISKMETNIKSISMQHVLSNLFFFLVCVCFAIRSLPFQAKCCRFSFCSIVCSRFANSAIVCSQWPNIHRQTRNSSEYNIKKKDHQSNWQKSYGGYKDPYICKSAHGSVRGVVDWKKI